MRRFLLHVLPGGFHRIRHYGLFSNGNRKANLARAREPQGAAPAAIDAQVPSPATERADVQHEDGPLKSSCMCRRCGGAMIILETFARGQPICAPPQQASAP